jgi:DNA-binding ferritin-like protein
MTTPGPASPAIVAGLSRVIADAYVLRFKTEVMMWQKIGCLGQAALLRPLHAYLDEVILLAATRIRVLGGSPPVTLGRIERLASVSGQTDQPDLAGLATAYSQTAQDLSSLATIARVSGDEVTALTLYGQVGRLEEAAFRIDQSASA